MIVTLLVATTLFVAYANGANDNFKGVATLYGSSTTTFRAALLLGTLATFAGCVASMFLAEALVKAFSGKGLVPDAIAASPVFLTAVACGAATTVMLATLLGLPISTTHALTGALVGAGLVGAGDALDLSVLGKAFFLPLLLSPLLSLLLTMPLYRLAKAFVDRTGIERHSCVCVGPRQFVPVSAVATARCGDMCGPDCGPAPLSVTVATVDECVQKYNGYLLGVSTQGLVDGLHYLSAAAVSFARGLNDTPKIVALLLIVRAFEVHVSMIAIAAAMALGGLVNSRKVAVTMSKRISRMNDGQALTANIVTTFMVIFASRLGMPVSTTHVSVGAISGIGIVNGTADRAVIGSILMSWLLTLPIAAVIAAAAYAIVQRGI
jgi:PiT family inorganic phosphate transporter